MKLVPTAISGKVGSLVAHVKDSVTDSVETAKLSRVLRRIFAALSPTGFALLLAAREMPFSPIRSALRWSPPPAETPSVLSRAPPSPHCWRGESRCYFPPWRSFWCGSAFLRCSARARPSR